MIKFSFKVFSNLEISFDGPHQAIGKTSNMYLVGNLYGAYLNEELVSAEQTIAKLVESIDDFEGIKKIIQSSGGDYYLIIKTTLGVRVFCSSNTVGLFYSFRNDHIIFTNIFDSLASTSNVSQLNHDQMFNYVFSGHNIRPAFETFFKDVNRSPGGTTIWVTRDLNMQSEIYVKQTYQNFNDSFINKPDQEKYEQFKFSVDMAGKLIAQGLKNKTVYVMVSGGADSAMMIASLLKGGLKPIAINWQSGGSQGRWQDQIIKSMSTEMGFEYIVIKGDPAKRIFSADDIERLYQVDLFEITKNPYLQLQQYFQENNIQDPIVFSGQNLDGLFEFFTTFKSANIGLRSNPIEFLVRRACEAMGTNYFFGDIFKFRKIFEFLIKRKIQYPYLDYLRAMANSLVGFETQLPYTFLKTLNQGNSQFQLPWKFLPHVDTEVAPVRKKTIGQINYNEVHLNIQERTVLSRLLDPQDLELVQSQTLMEKPTYFNHLVRLMKYLNAHQPFILKYTTMSRKLGYELKNYGDQDFLRKFCLTYNRNSLKDLILPKRFKYRYINETLKNETYKSITKEAAILTGWRRPFHKVVFSEVKSILKWLRGLYRGMFVTHANIGGRDISPLRDVWQRNAERSFTLEQLNLSPVIMTYFKDLESKIVSEQKISDKYDVYEIERLVNLKVFLNSLIEKQKELKQ